jgi:hypothetical protein
VDTTANVVIRRALEHNLLKRLPLTFRPYFNQEIQSWTVKFPYERLYLERVVGYLDTLSPEQFELLFRAMRGLESRMNVNPRSFSLEEQTIEGASVLARSPHYHEWREEVNRVFEHIHVSALEQEQARMASLNRLLLQVFPADLPLNPGDLLTRWPEAQIKRLTWPEGSGTPRLLREAILKGQPQPDGIRGPGFLEEFAARKERGLGDVWLIEAGTALRELLPGLEPGPDGHTRAIRLSFEGLRPLREAFVGQIRSMRKTLADADSIMHRLRTLDVAARCPREIGDVPAIREFVRSLLLSNNGSQLFSNAFVEWGTSQAVAHARPLVVVGEFSLRSKPKPFTSVAIFEDPAKANPLPSEPDPEGSAVDAGILAYYAWLGMRRYPECRRAACLCLFESARYLLIAGAEDFPLWKEPEPVSPDRVGSLLRSWLA